MLVLKTISALAISLAFSTGTAQALSLQEGSQPAEFPPAGYSADVYVDSRGCMYIRAGFSGSVTWVPRVSRSREVVCGARPTTGSGTQVANAPSVVTPSAPPITLAPAVATPIVVPSAPIMRTPIIAPAPVIAAPVVPVAPAPSNAITRNVALTCPVGGSNRNVRASGVTIPLRCDAGQVGSIVYIVAHRNGERTRVTVNPAAAVVVQAQVIVPQGPTTAGNSGCANRSGVGQAYTNSGAFVRCGSQTLAPVPGLGTTNGGYGRVTITTPSGYGGGTGGTGGCANRSIVGQAYTNSGAGVRCGSQTVAPVPGLGTTGYVNGGTYAPSVTISPVVVPDGYRSAWDDGRLNPNRGPQTLLGTAQMNQVWTQTTPRRLVTVAPAVTTIRARAPAVVAPAAPVAPAVTGKRYVQVATFGVAANAQRTIARLQGMGFPVSVSNVTRSGKSYQIIMAGPFTQQAALNSALSQVRGVGFSDAYLR